MSQQLVTVEKLLSRIAAADRSNQREIRLTIQEGKDLAIELALLSTQLVSTIKHIDTQLNEINRDNSISVKMSGGKF